MNQAAHNPPLATPPKATPADTLFSQPFNNGLWRKLLQGVCQEVDAQYALGLDVISPFGFELLEDKRYLYKNLKRFYCYVGFPEKANVDKHDIEKAYADALLKTLKQHYPAVFDDIAILITHNNKLHKFRPDNYLCTPADKLIDISAHPVKKDILSHYADYLTASVSTLFNKTGEADVERNSEYVMRVRYYQLYIISETLYSQYLPALSPQEIRLSRSVFASLSNSIQALFTPQSTPPTEEEKYIAKHLIDKRLARMHAFLTAASEKAADIVTIETGCYHTDHHFSFSLNQDIYEDATSKVKSTYLNFS